MYYVYILHSNLIEKYYIGCTSMEIEKRLRRHLSSHSGFTGRAKDWKVVYFESFDSKQFALLREQEIKKWKSRAKIMELISN